MGITCAIFVLQKKVSVRLILSNIIVKRMFILARLCAEAEHLSLGVHQGNPQEKSPHVNSGCHPTFLVRKCLKHDGLLPGR